MALVFRKVTAADPVVAYLTLEITEHLLDGEKVLWLVSGGSSIKIAVDIAEKLESIDLRNLTVSLVDERYGPPGHQDSNWAQLIDNGFRLPNANLVPVLDGSSMEATIRRFDRVLDRLIGNADYKVGLLGIGTDSHIAGIKAESKATSATGLAVGYDWDDFKRITMTFPAIERLDAVVVYLSGESKQAAIEALQSDASLKQIPSQILKRVKKAVVFNDRLGDEIT